ncbi:MAG: DNA-directed RNA polymerase subunit delta [Alkalibacterium sp.]|uniref:DNA-directed RNA polymerase subunit delta n=1 Tax=Alkalibacterium TaxID=99906 RepID=UPI002648DED1|nr:DNA-directed RNA polymerase subunit delta [Alkalibacterium sp.]MDN6193512.1 DNA-directed RNA polymerase subunit delta [Alkalibacterium sp.]MDN6294064.1 DNA-directed RNA polymerase subunit delta [Alkalibacterium sp.]MDN6295672.1 DNA-directed RNA polymerase subunit delta [Alkalibacterium sp.]MDN6326544.1 DNA-directed RNA polymerase subunit delta [Alkalibacterium sp.]MDN6397860.1 DNA-directed RNA polymerase subunit delta [Alkalibacterium sp.]
MELTQFKDQNKEELAMVEVGHAMLQTTGKVKDFNDLLSEVAGYLNLSDADLEEDMVQFYTDLNIDGRFISLGDNRWGLRSWYPIDLIDEENTHNNDEEDEKPRRRKKHLGFDEDIEDEEFEEDEDDEDDDEPIKYGDRVEVDEHGVMVEDEDDEDLGEYKDDLEDLDDVEEDDEDLKGLNIVDDEEALGDDEKDDEE